KVRGLGATPKVRQPLVPWYPRLCLQAVALQPPHPMPAGKDRFCPVRARLFPSYNCRAWCWHDGECPHEEKCCLHGCDYVCVPPSRGATYGQGCPLAPGTPRCLLSPEKPGICPLAEEALLAPCGTTCRGGGLRSAAAAADVATCAQPPNQVRPQHTSEPCTETDSCTHDRDCSRQEKCCFSGCAMRCTRPAQGERGSPATSTGK
ncbi:hypothetical protein IHE44_0004555, partial [Lamprotornis superbus]